MCTLCGRTIGERGAKDNRWRGAKGGGNKAVVGPVLGVFSLLWNGRCSFQQNSTVVVCGTGLPASLALQLAPLLSAVHPSAVVCYRKRRNPRRHLPQPNNGTQRNTTEHNGTQRNTTEQVATQRNTTEHNGTGRNGTLPFRSVVPPSFVVGSSGCRAAVLPPPLVGGQERIEWCAVPQPPSVVSPFHVVLVVVLPAPPSSSPLHSVPKFSVDRSSSTPHHARARALVRVSPPRRRRRALRLQSPVVPSARP